MLRDLHFRTLSFTVSAFVSCVVIPLVAVNAGAGVVINEILYNAPNDLDQLEFIELHNHGADEADVSGWKLTKGVSHTFPSGTLVQPGGFLVVCKNQELFSRFYSDVTPSGTFEKGLSNSSDKVNLKDASGKVIDSVEYADRTPWPVSPDGYSASLERICPTEQASFANWAPSLLSASDSSKPSGTPGRENSSFKPFLPPVVESVSTPESPTVTPGSTPIVTAVVGNATAVSLLYRVVAPGGAGGEVRLPMTNTSEGSYSATIPGQAANRIVRYRVEALGANGVVRIHPHENDLRPAYSFYVTSAVEAGKIPVAHFFNIGQEAFKNAEQYRNNARSTGRRGGFNGFRGRPELTAEDRARMDVERALNDVDIAGAWTALTLTENDLITRPGQLRPIFQRANVEVGALRRELVETTAPQEVAAALGAKVREITAVLKEEAVPLIDPSQKSILERLGTAERDRGGDRRGRGPAASDMLQRILDVESVWFRISMNPEVGDEVFNQLRGVYTDAVKARAGTVMDADGGRPDFGAIIEAIDQQRSALTTALEASVGAERTASLKLIPDNPFRDFGRDRRRRGGSGRGGSGPVTPFPAQGESAFIYTDPATGVTQLFDFVNITQRKSGYKVRLHKDRPLSGMTSINVLYEPGEVTILNEALAYDLYRAAGNATQRAGYVRVVMDGQIVGHHLWFEQPNGAFFRHNDIDDEGNLYKVIWQGGNQPTEFTPEDKKPKRRDDLVGRHEKKSNPHDGYDDLIALVEALESEGDDAAMWKLIQHHFDVDQVINYFAVNSLISHWDGFFNNYFLYHDTQRKKWMIYPWDQDSTWSQRGGDPAELYRMPLDFGAEGATPPGSESSAGEGRSRERRGGFGRRGFSWWRDGGEISRPLLANPSFRDRFLARLKELTETVFTESAFGKNIDALESAIEPETRVRATANSQDPDQAAAAFRTTIASLRRHLAERRAFIQQELKSK